MPKFNDIPQLTRSNGYQVNVSLKYLPTQISEYIEEGLEINPDFQRGHVWTEEQQVKYVEFLLRGGRSSRDIYFNHPNWHEGKDGDFVCVDGLQRLTAVRKFMNNEIKAFGYLCSEYEDRSYLNTISLIFHVNDLKTRAEVLQWYLEFNEGGTVHTQEELDRVAKLLKEEKAK